MFYALSEQLEIVKGVKINHLELRHSLVQYLREYPKLVSIWCMLCVEQILQMNCY